MGGGSNPGLVDTKISNLFIKDPKLLALKLKVTLAVVEQGLDKRIKDTVDIIIPNKSETENKWNEINDILSDELEKNLKI